MAIDRVALLRNAEILLRQGKLDQAIAEYRRIVDDQPRDWNTANVLGDLYVRAGQIDKAVDEYIRVADSLGQDGFLVEGQRPLQEDPQDSSSRRARAACKRRKLPPVRDCLSMPGPT